MTRKIHRYESDGIVVEYDVRRCIHAEECVHGLPEVFDPEARPWIRPERADPDSLADVVQRCPTGALRLSDPEGRRRETAPEANVIRVDPDGPLYLRGRLRVDLPGGETLEDMRVALCRCGLSRDKPFCDGSHTDGGFRDDGRIGESRLAEDAASGGEPAPLEVSFAKNGPTLLSGPVSLVGSDGTTARGVRGALCRCGRSGAKPFCDGTHKQTGFEAD